MLTLGRWKMLSNDKNLSLWQLTNEHQQLLSQLYDHDTGEINELVQARLNELEPSIEKKCIAVTKWIRKIESEEKQLDELLNEITDRKRAYEREGEKYKRYLQENMERQGIRELVSPFFSVRLRRNPYSTEIINQDEIPQQFIKVKEVVKVNVTVDKCLIKEEVLRTGHQVPGAYVSQKNKLEIVIDKI